jgi:hypothetical protein
MDDGILSNNATSRAWGESIGEDSRREGGRQRSLSKQGKGCGKGLETRVCRSDEHSNYESRVDYRLTASDNAFAQTWKSSKQMSQMVERGAKRSGRGWNERI